MKFLKDPYPPSRIRSEEISSENNIFGKTQNPADDTLDNPSYFDIQLDRTNVNEQEEEPDALASDSEDSAEDYRSEENTQKIRRIRF